MNLAPSWRGGERQTLLLMEGLRERGVTNVLLARRGAPMAHRARAAGFEAKELGVLRSIGALRGHDVVHAHEARAVGLAVLTKAWHRAPVVATRRVDKPPGRGWLTHRKYRGVDRLVAISVAVRTVLHQWDSGLGLLPVIPSAVPVESAADPGRVALLRERFGGKHVIGTVGALVIRQKDPLMLIRGFARLAQNRSDVVLVLVGDGPDRHALEVEVARLGLQQRVFFEGFQADPWSYYAILDVFALTSRMEGLGTAILDAFAYRVPVVATRAGGIPELIGADDRGWLVESGDPEGLAHCLGQALDQPTEAVRRAAQARQYLTSHHSVAAMAEAYHRIYAELLGAPRLD